MTQKSEYGKAIFDLAKELNRVEIIERDLEFLDTVLSENPDYKMLLDTPSIPTEEKLKLISEAFSDIDEYVLNLFKIICERKLVHTFPEIYKTFVELKEEAYGIIRVECESCIELSKKQTEGIIKKLESATGKTVILKNIVSPEILGGIKLRYMGKQLDGSLATRLGKIEEALKNVIM